MSVTSGTNVNGELRLVARSIVDAALSAVDPIAAMRQHVAVRGSALVFGESTVDLNAFERVFVIGAGKAGASMAAALEEMLDDRIVVGEVIVKDGHTTPLRLLRLHEASHPVPDQRGVRATEAVLDLVGHAGCRDLVVCLLSGGGSALLVRPVDGVSLQDLQATTEALLACGGDIVEINVLRKHLSAVKGGQLARLAQPATLISLIVSDVVGDPLDAIASGPTAPDPTTFGDCLRVLQRYQLVGRVPASVRRHLEAGAAGRRPETPKPGDPMFAKVSNLVIANIDQAVRAAALEAAELGFEPCVLSTAMEGEAREVARVHVAIAREIRRTGRPVAAPACVLSGGEPTVTLRGTGKGGRNQEFVLAAALDLVGEENVLVGSIGTDGTDGPTEAAGAWADGQSVALGAAKGLDARAYLDNNDSYAYLTGIDALVITGPTGTNVMDLRLLLVGS